MAIMNEMKTLEFTLAPVQKFVSQARRTRDYWAGSYLLSYLTANAIKGVCNSGTKNNIRFLQIEKEPLLRAVIGGQIGSKEELSIASIPNHFTADCEDPVAAGKAGEKALRDAWQGIAAGVWDEVRTRLSESETLKKKLTELGSADLPPVWKRQIENLWEIYWVAGAQEGMNERKNWRYQFFIEEDGEVCTVCGERVVVFGEKQSRQEVRELWHGQDGIVKKINAKWPLALDNENTERLCAVCLIKRIYSHLAEKLFGWEVNTEFPTTHKFAELSGKDAQGEPFPYYALLRMDGDQIGIKLRDHPERQGEISDAITGFSHQVRKIVERNNGRVVYAGGDDVLAFLPMTKALVCAAELREEFIIQQRNLRKISLSISAAILILHKMSPLQSALADTAKLLDGIAKDGMGRNAFVVQVQKRNGPPLTVAKPWEKKGVSGEEPAGWIQTILDLTRTIFLALTREYSTGFLYKISALLEPFACIKDGSLSESDLIAVLTAEYLRNRELDWPSDYGQSEIWEEARKRMKRLYDLCKWEPRPEGNMQNQRFQTEAPQLLHFLASPEVKP